MRSYVDRSATGFLPFEVRIAPRHPKDPPPSRPVRPIPDGSRPVREGRPFLAVVSVLIFSLAVWMQVGRYQDCRAVGGGVVACLVNP